VAGTLERLRAAAERLGSTFPEVEEVWLFGSLARGDAVPGSDADVLVVLSRSEIPFLERPVRYRVEQCGIGVDLFAYTREELERMGREGRRFTAQAMREAVLLWRRSPMEEG